MAPFRFSKEDIPLRARFTMIQRQANLCKTEVLEICPKKKDIPIKFQVRRFHGQTVLKLGEEREEGEKILFLWPIQFPYTEEKERGGVIFEQPRRK